MKFLYAVTTLFIGLGVFLLTLGAYEFIRTVGERPIITSAEDLRGRHGQRVRVGTELTYTNNSMRYTERRTGQHGATTRTWYLHIVHFEDAAVVFRSIHHDAHTREAVYATVERASADSIYARLWRQYYRTNEGMFPYALRFYNIDTPGGLLIGGLVVLPIGLFFGGIIYLVRKWRKR